MIKNINQAYDYLYSFINLEKNPDSIKDNNFYSIDNIKKIIKHFDSPHENKKIFHIAGTKGKGSVSYFISKLLMLLGHDVCTFVSPHLIEMNERILYNLLPINNKDLVFFVNKIQEVQGLYNFTPTTFELFFILFLLYAKKNKIDHLVIEVGLGGRLDCTNIVDPLVSVITPISLDHTNILGNSISKIAGEKAGIIKKNTPIIVANQKISAMNVFKKKAYDNNSLLYSIKNRFKVFRILPVNDGLFIDFKFDEFIFKDFFISLIGRHQIDNFFCGLLSVYIVYPEIIKIIKKYNRIELTIPGRIELLDKKLPVILDVAHNKESGNKLKETLLFHYPKLRWNVLSGMVIDKDYKNFYREIKNITENLIITTPSKFKKSEPGKVYSSAKSIIKKTEFIEDFEEASDKLLKQKKPILITGSFYIAGPFLEFWRKYKK